MILFLTFNHAQHSLEVNLWLCVSSVEDVLDNVVVHDFLKCVPVSSVNSIFHAELIRPVQFVIMTHKALLGWHTCTLLCTFHALLSQNLGKYYIIYTSERKDKPGWIQTKQSGQLPIANDLNKLIEYANKGEEFRLFLVTVFFRCTFLRSLLSLLFVTNLKQYT